MDARLSIRLVSVGLAIVAWTSGMSGLSRSASAARPATRNFVVVNSPSSELAAKVVEEAERYRRELALHWLGKELPPWPQPCVLNIVAGNIPAQGETTYSRFPGYVADFRMTVVGTPERILDSVLPHEVTHTVLATYFGKPLPRWADEGISTTVEHQSEKAKHDLKLREFLTTNRGIPMNHLFTMRDYPPEMLTLYAQGYSVCTFFVQQKGPREFIQFLETFGTQRSWTAAVEKHYGYESLAEMQEAWVAWVASGSKDVAPYAKNAGPGQADTGVMVASLESGSALAEDNRGQKIAATGSWYANVRDGNVAPVNEGSGADTGIYSAAQPQPMGGVSASPTSGQSSPWSAQPARLWR